jgi:hypothetical protein
MVLGVDDFTQEFAYLAGRDQWLARDAIGYGTLSGLAVFVEDGGVDGPRLRVAAGSAVVPSGKLVCVPADQCCVLNKWLAKPENAKTVIQLLGGGSPPLSPPMSSPLSPPASSGTISLYLTLCYADCLTAPVPIPGEPCRSEDELMAPSRVADDFCLELRAEAPPQIEEDALRDFVRWLKSNVQVVETSPPPAGDAATWLALLEEAVQPWFDAMKASPPSSPPLSPPVSIPTLGDYLAGLTPLNLTVTHDQFCSFLRVAFRFWVTALRPWVSELRPLPTEPRARRCHPLADKNRDCVLLARVEFPVVWVGGSPTGAWQVDGSPATVSVDESARPFIVHLRLLQEWMLCGCDCAGGGPALPESGLPQGLAATDTPTFAGLTTTGAVQVAFLRTTANITLGATHHVVVCQGAVSLTLPKCAADNRGRLYIIKATGAPSTLVLAAGDMIVGGTATVAVATPRTIVSDGSTTWYVIS